MTQNSATAGMLYIVATPIGNREDITIRAQKILNTVDFIIAEDTRHSLPLLQALGINKHLTSLHAHNEQDKSAAIIESILAGKNAALISDAGTPLISDPGFPLVRMARTHGIIVVPVPGPCALITALSAAGLPCDTFTFAGFLPAKSQARQKVFSEWQTLSHTLVFYESTHRILDSLDDIATVYGPDKEISLAKELTKTFERFINGSVCAVKAELLAKPELQKGEFVLILAANKPAADEFLKSDRILLGALLAELPVKCCRATKPHS